MRYALAALACMAIGAAHAATPAHSAAPTTPPNTAASTGGSPYVRSTQSETAAARYTIEWGVSDMKVRLTSQGTLVRFTYHVVEATKAKALADKAAAPKMFNPRTHAELQIPVMEKIGELRQTTGLESGKDYWMVFSNSGGLVKSGDRVAVRAGTFYVEGLLVE
jgi:hypothetical protein